MKRDFVFAWALDLSRSFWFEDGSSFRLCWLLPRNILIDHDCKGLSYAVLVVDEHDFEIVCEIVTLIAAKFTNRE